MAGDDSIPVDVEEAPGEDFRINVDDVGLVANPGIDVDRRTGVGASLYRPGPVTRERLARRIEIEARAFANTPRHG